MSDMSVTRKAALWVGVVFLLGAALGGMTGYVFARHTALAAPPQMNEVARRAQKVQRRKQELELVPEQQKQLEAIRAGGQAKYKDIREAAEPQVNEARKKGWEQIRAMLTAEKKPKFEEFLKHLDEERK